MNGQLRRRVRPNDPDTSWEAAASQTTGKTAELQIAIMGRLRAHGPMTYDELAGLLHHWSPSGVRTRTKELRELGWVTEHRGRDGKVIKRRAEGGQPSIVWRACDPGEVTGVDRTELPALRDAALDAFDLESLRAAVRDALRIYDDVVAASTSRAAAADDMAARLRGLARVTYEEPDDRLF